MANQVVTVIENQLPAEPDIAQLSQMQAPIVMVHKITRGEKNKENTQLIINGQTGLTMKEILQLQDVLPAGQVFPNSGPGIYRFSVTDGDSAAKCAWQTRLGGAVLEGPAPAPAPAQALPFGVPFTASAVRPVPPPAVAPTAGVRSIGNGVYYDPELALLTLPDGSVHPWRPGTPLPAAATTAVTQTAAPATPVSAFAGPGTPFFAQQPSPELEATKVALAQTQRALEDLQRRQEEERREQARRQEMDSLHAALGKIVERLNAPPPPPPREDSEVAELKRRLERQEEMAALRAESKAQIDAIMALVREQANNRGVDPMVTFMTSMMKDGQIATAETLRMIRETAGAERQTFLTMLDRQAAAAEKAAANNPFEKVGAVVDLLVDKVGSVMRMERDFSGGGGGTDWVGLIKEAVSKAGSAVEMYQSAKAQEASAIEAKAKADIAKANATASISRDRALVAVQGGKRPPAPAPAPTPAPTPSPTRAKVELPDLEKATLAELRSIFSPERDEVFFGAFFDHVKQLRAAVAVPGALGAGKIAELLMEAREFIAQAAQEGKGVPHAAEIWAHGQVPYLLERLLPEASEGLRSEVVKALLKLQIEAEDAERIAANTAVEGEDE